MVTARWVLQYIQFINFIVNVTVKLNRNQSVSAVTDCN